MSDRIDRPGPDHVFDRGALTRFADEAGSGVVPPSFTDIVAAQRRRRRTTVVGAAAAAVAVFALVFTGVQAVYDDRATPAPANPTPSVNTTPTEPDTTKSSDSDLTPTQIVNGRHSHIASVAVSPLDPDTRAVVWQHCGTAVDCETQVFALTVTDDGFATSHDIALASGTWPRVVSLDDGTFYVTSGRTSAIIDASGVVSKLAIGDPRARLPTC